MKERGLGFSEVVSELNRSHWIYGILAILIIIGLFLAVYFGAFASLGEGTRTPSDVMPDFYSDYDEDYYYQQELYQEWQLERFQ